jgi:hypothetical protein
MTVKTGGGVTNPRVKNIASFPPIPPALLTCVRLLCYVFDPRVSNELRGQPKQTGHPFSYIGVPDGTMRRMYARWLRFRVPVRWWGMRLALLDVNRNIVQSFIGS